MEVALIAMPRDDYIPSTPVKRARNILASVKLDRKERRKQGTPRRSALRGIIARGGSPIFIVGAPRSGTTFLGDAISRHPEISYHFEPAAMKRLAPSVLADEVPDGIAAAHVRALHFALLTVEAEGHLRLAEKTPQNCFLISHLARWFPDAGFVYIYRDALDAVASYLEKPWLCEAGAATVRWEPGGYRWGPFARFWVEPARIAEFESATDATRCAWAWRAFNEAALRQLEGVSQTHRVIRVQYEAFHGNGSEMATRICEAMDLSSDGLPQLTDALSKFTAKSIGSGRHRLGDSEITQIHNEAGDVLARLGYSQ